MCPFVVLRVAAAGAEAYGSRHPVADVLSPPGPKGVAQGLKCFWVVGLGFRGVGIWGLGLRVYRV